MEIFEDIAKNLTAFVVSPSGSGLFVAFQTLFILLSIGLVVFIILALSKCSWLKFRFIFDIVEFLTYRPFGTKKIEKDWKKINLRLNSGLESEYKLAIIEADNMLNQVLKDMRYDGDGLIERLESVKGTVLQDIEEIKRAHKIRNNIIYDPNYKLSFDDAKKCLAIFEKTLKQLDVF